MYQLLEAPQLHTGLYPETGLTTIAYYQVHIQYKWNCRKNIQRGASMNENVVCCLRRFPPYFAIWRMIQVIGVADDHFIANHSTEKSRTQRIIIHLVLNRIPLGIICFYVLNSKDIPTKMFGYNSSWSHGLSLRRLKCLHWLLCTCQVIVWMWVTLTHCNGRARFEPY